MHSNYSLAENISGYCDAVKKLNRHLEAFYQNVEKHTDKYEPSKLNDFKSEILDNRVYWRSQYGLIPRSLLRL